MYLTWFCKLNLWTYLTLTFDLKTRVIILVLLPTIDGIVQNPICVVNLDFHRIPWFQYPIIYDIRARPRKISSPTGSKGKNCSNSLILLLNVKLVKFCFINLLLK